MELCQTCGKHCLPISFSEYITKYFRSPNEDLIVPEIEIDNGLFKRMSLISSAISSGLSYFYGLKSEVMKQVYASSLFFHASSLYMIDIGVELVLEWYKNITLWNKFLALRNERCKNFNIFLTSSFKELVLKASKVKKKLFKVLSNRGKEIVDYSIKIHKKVGEEWFCKKLKNLKIEGEDFYLEFVYNITSILSIFIDVFIGIVLSVDQMLTSNRIIYTQGFASLYLDGINVLDFFCQEFKKENIKQIKTIKPEILTIAKLNARDCNLNCKVY